MTSFYIISIRICSPQEGGTWPDMTRPRHREVYEDGDTTATRLKELRPVREIHPDGSECVPVLRP